MIKARTGIAAVAVLLGICGVNNASAQWYEIPFSSGYGTPSMQGVNGDGTLVGGTETIATGSLVQNFYWSPGTGKVQITPARGGFLVMRGSSDVGAWVGFEPEFGGSGANTAKILYRDGTIRSLGRSPAYQISEARDCDATCTTVIGMDLKSVRIGTNLYQWQGQPFVWTATGGRQSLPHAVSGVTYTKLNGVSRDGRIAVGYSGNQSYGTAVTWTAETGYQILPLPDGSPRSYYATDVSGDGSVVIGLCGSPTGASDEWSTYWDAAGAHVIDTSGWRFALPKFTNGDGSVIVGEGVNLALSGASRSDNWIFTREGGVQSLRQYLINMGLSVSEDHTLLSVSGVSQDGRTFSGTARNPLTNHYIGFVATVPAPGSLAWLAAVGFVGVRPRRRRNMGP